eukprot:302134-Chlamydomonas_euryale.AAC.1
MVSFSICRAQHRQRGGQQGSGGGRPVGATTEDVCACVVVVMGAGAPGLLGGGRSKTATGGRSKTATGGRSKNSNRRAIQNSNRRGQQLCL